MTYKEIITFHGHECPGIAIGYKMATTAMEALNSFRSKDEEIITIVENDACGIDVVQCVTGCTFGKGNLRFRDYGKQVYTIYSRTAKKGIRVVFHGKDIPQKLYKNRPALIQWILSAPVDAIISFTTVSILEPEPSRIRKSKRCSFCDERVMESRIVELYERSACIPCYEKSTGVPVLL